MSTVAKISKLFVALSVGVLLQQGSALAGDQDFTLHNETGVEIHNVYVSAHSVNDWEEDILGKDTLPDGEAVEISFSPKENADNWDLQVTDKDGNSITWENLKLTEITDVILHYDQKSGKATAETKNGS